MIDISRKASSFSESVIREMARLAMAHDAVNLAQGFPDFACPPELKQAACAAIEADINQYAITWGARDFRGPIAAKTARHYPGWRVDCGATEGMIASHAGRARSGRRGGRLRAVLRELQAPTPSSPAPSRAT